MYWATVVARVLLGLPFLVFGLNHFLKFMPMPSQPDLPENAKLFTTALIDSGYLNVVKVLEVVGGALLLSGRFVPLGVTIVTPVAVNILLTEIFLMGQPGLGVVLVALCAFLVWAYRSHFAPVFAANARTG
jgi:uncharacterized membrane protein YphA (DoxX/SURF4 family)